MAMSCLPCPAIQTIGPGNANISLWTPLTVNMRTIRLSVAAATQPVPAVTAYDTKQTWNYETNI